MKKCLLLPIFIVALNLYTASAQDAPTGLVVSNTTDNHTTVSWQASTATTTTGTKVESFDQPFGTSSWNSGGYDWNSANSDTRGYNGLVRTGSASWYIGRNDNSLTFNVPFTLKGLWIYPSNLTSYTIKAYSSNNIELYTKTTSVSFSFGFEYVTLNWSNVKKINISFVSSGSGPSGSIVVDDLNYTPSENVYPYYVSTVNAAPASNEAASGIFTGTAAGIGGLQPATTYYLWMRTYDGSSYGNWTDSPISFTTTNVLPIVLKDFTAKKKNNHVALKWTTLSEQNNKAFVLSHATDGKNFEVITELQGKGTTSSVSTYAFEHLSPLAGTNYYKLQQLDFNGDVKELGIKTIDFKLTNNISLYPNPVTEKAVITFDTGCQAIEIINVNGTVLQTLSVSKTDTNKEISLANYPSAIYFVKLVGINKMDILKVIKN
ncbi:T9SS type A sorting domain-containing protein [Pedobacter sp. ASV28]|uniref:T9SS type A sorting domain-containing protein n=1 Tax=Pedobacter sp. ASV28 TaxID=2795123 RepID=UPI0018EA87BC|nr:T9SS type A sorting domain-containing protein [Pedobacter sp. ASV28]